MPHKNPEDRRVWQFKRHLKRFYNMTIEEYERIVDEQNGVCALCGNSPTTTLGVDHDHQTGRIRGLICLHCNNRIGAIEKVGLDKITEYLLNDKKIAGFGVVHNKNLKSWR